MHVVRQAHCAREVGVAPPGGSSWIVSRQGTTSLHGARQEPLAYASCAGVQHREKPLSNANCAEVRRNQEPLSIQRAVGVQREDTGGAYLGGSCQRKDGAAETEGGNAVGFARAW
ncbi:hypothetical protein HPB50_007864 [Hyalomma asiaticum]|uniref:Uncharacterized protein n=1 Tax=Hyalomma asiaticum TaxID=266040 RepID=A0ACB7TEF4_HYAAI|nr:hypothetical protein HPB50_007864 [Hyalomma asiaticum]